MRIALAQLNPTVGDVAGNLGLILEAMKTARRDGAEVIVTSELALIGYPPRDLLLREGVVEACERAVMVIARAAGEMTVIVGHPRRCDGGTRPLRNSASVCRAGRVMAVCDKQLLPGYDVFDEDRYFEPGARSLVVDIAGQRCGIVICEDLWRAADVAVERRYAIEPVAELAAQNAEIIIALNASPFVLGKWQKHLRQLSEIASDNHVPVIAVNQVGANDDLIFDGRSVVVAPDGRVVEILAGFESDLRVIDVPLNANAQTFTGTDRAAGETDRWSSAPREIFHALVLGIRDYCRKTGQRDVHLGLSGGVDSALVATLAAKAVGPARVHGVMMPSIYSSRGSIDDSVALAERLRLGSLREARIDDLHEGLRGAMHSALGTKPAGITDENIQARLRGVLLMAISNHAGGLVLATSNKSEMAVGYSTLYGDMCGAIAPLGDLTKTRIYELARWINANFQECGCATAPIPQNSLDKPPSAELRPNQTDQDTLPPYELLDQVIERRIELEQSEETVIAQSGIDPDVVRKSLAMIDRPQFKRDQAPVVLKVTGRAFGPGRPMPVVMRQTDVSDLRPDPGDQSAGENLSIARTNLRSMPDPAQSPMRSQPAADL
jgi:NAD+ synthase/NAD+ synthase (glutamine-hydrolysing)